MFDLHFAVTFFKYFFFSLSSSLLLVLMLLLLLWLLILSVFLCGISNLYGGIWDDDESWNTQQEKWMRVRNENETTTMRIAKVLKGIQNKSAAVAHTNKIGCNADEVEIDVVIERKRNSLCFDERTKNFYIFLCAPFCFVSFYSISFFIIVIVIVNVIAKCKNFIFVARKKHFAHDDVELWTMGGDGIGKCLKLVSISGCALLIYAFYTFACRLNLKWNKKAQ